MTTLTNSDIATAAHVNAELFFDPRVGSSDIHAEVNHGHVTISGIADTYSTKWAAEHAALRVRGVHAVENLITVEPKLLEMPSDADLATSVRTALDWDIAIPASRLQVLVLDGDVVLSGNVDWYYQRVAAEEAAIGIRGVRSVTSHISITPPMASHTEISHDIKSALVRNARLDAGRITVSVEGDTVNLSGNVSSWSERHEAAEAAWRAKGVANVKNDIVIVAS